MDQSDGGTSTRPTQTTDTAMTSQHEAVVLQQGCASAEPLQGRAGNAWNSPGAKGWGLLELGWVWTGRQGTAGRGELGWGPSLKAPARFWSGANGHTASWVLWFCAKRARSTDPTQAAVDHGGQQVASGVGIMADPGFTLAYLHLQLRLSWGAALCQAPPLCNHVFFALEVSWNFCEDSFKRGGDGASAVVVIIPGMVRKTSQQS